MKKKGIMEKLSYERCVYESVDDKSLSWDRSQKWTENRIHAAKGLIKLLVLEYEKVVLKRENKN